MRPLPPEDLPRDVSRFGYLRGCLRSVQTRDRELIFFRIYKLMISLEIENSDRIRDHMIKDRIFKNLSRFRNISRSLWLSAQLFGGIYRFEMENLYLSEFIA